MKLLKKLGIPTLALAGTMALFSPSPANAAVRFGVGVGVAPYYAPYAYPNPYYAYPYYGYPYAYAPYGVYGGWGWGGGWGGHVGGWGHGFGGHVGGHFGGGHRGRR